MVKKVNFKMGNYVNKFKTLGAAEPKPVKEVKIDMVAEVWGMYRYPKVGHPLCKIKLHLGT